MAQPPQGVVTLMQTDIEGSSRLWELLGARFVAELARHDAIIRAALALHGGYEVQTSGDAFMLAIAEAADALRCAADVQIALAAEPADDASSACRSPSSSPPPACA